MYEILSNYQNNPNINPAIRTKTLQKLIAAAVAYSAPCPEGSLSDMVPYYNELCKENAYKVVSRVNETILVNSDEVLADIEKVWKGRYELVNSPLACNAIEEFHKEMETFGSDVTSHYNQYVESFLRAVSTYLVKVNGGM